LISVTNKHRDKLRMKAFHYQPKGRRELGRSKQRWRDQYHLGIHRNRG